MVYITSAEYAARAGKSAFSVLRKCRSGGFASAVEQGGRWYIDESEPYVDARKVRRAYLSASSGPDKAGLIAVGKAYRLVKDALGETDLPPEALARPLQALSLCYVNAQNAGLVTPDIEAAVRDALQLTETYFETSDLCEGDRAAVVYGYTLGGAAGKSES